MAETPRSKPRYKLTYFNIKGRAEPVRLLFKAAGVPFQDDKISFAQWPGLKASTPFGSLPVLEVNNTQFAENGAIFRWAALKFGMLGKTDAEMLTVLSAIEQTLAVFNPFVPWFYVAEDKEEGLPEMKEKLDKLLTTWEGLAVETKAQSRTYTYLAGTSLTAADLLMFCLLDELCNCEMANKFDLSRFPKMLNLHSTVGNLPRIKEYQLGQTKK